MLATDDVLFICPRCGKPALSIHRKTYEKSIIVFCTSCRLHTTSTPSKEAYYDMELAYQEFLSQYRAALKQPTPA